MKETNQLTTILPAFPFYLRRSFYMHVALLSLTLVGGKVIIEQRKILRDKNIQLVEASVRVDMVAMPKYTLNELKNVSSGMEDAQKEEAKKETVKEVAKEETKIESKEEPKVEEKTAGPTFEEIQQKKRQDFLGKLKAIGSKKVVSSGDQKIEKGMGGEKTSALKDLVIAGNKLNAGTATYGSGNTAEMTAFQIYVSKLPDLVRSNWVLPTFLIKEKNLRCKIQVWLNGNGELINSQIYESSNNLDFDQKALEAVRKTRFPKIKDEFKNKAMNGQIVFGFPR